MRGPQTLRGLGAALALLGTSPADAQGLSIAVRPACIEPAPDLSYFVAVFGYESAEPSLVQVLVGPDNQFSPGPADRGQVSIFLTGFFPRAFRVPFAPSPSQPALTWNFLGSSVTADWTSPLCHTQQQAPLVVQATPPTIAVGASSTLSASGGSGVGEVSFTVQRGSLVGPNCTLDGAVLTGVRLGTCRVTATKAGDLSFASASASIDVQVSLAGSDLRITKTSGSPVAIRGEPMIYEIVVSNAGPVAQGATHVQDPVPIGLSDATWSCESVVGASCPSASGNGGINEFVTLPVGASLRFRLVATVTAAAGATITNTATVSAVGSADLSPGDNVATVVRTVEVRDFVFESGFE